MKDYPVRQFQALLHWVLQQSEPFMGNRIVQCEHGWNAVPVSMAQDAAVNKGSGEGPGLEVNDIGMVCKNLPGAWSPIMNAAVVFCRRRSLLRWIQPVRIDFPIIFRVNFSTTCLLQAGKQIVAVIADSTYFGPKRGEQSYFHYAESIRLFNKR